MVSSNYSKKERINTLLGRALSQLREGDVDACLKSLDMAKFSLLIEHGVPFADAVAWFKDQR